MERLSAAISRACSESCWPHFAVLSRARRARQQVVCTYKYLHENQYVTYLISPRHREPAGPNSKSHSKLPIVALWDAATGTIKSDLIIIQARPRSDILLIAPARMPSPTALTSGGPATRAALPRAQELPELLFKDDSCFHAPHDFNARLQRSSTRLASRHCPAVAHRVLLCCCAVQCAPHVVPVEDAACDDLLRGPSPRCRYRTHSL